ncbi:MAG TPA: sigma-54 dependent transcriptional regulator [Chitinophagaceae bacterium]
MAKKVLIIDDDVDLCLLLSRFLTKKGFVAEVAYSGHKGIALYKTEKFDAVISDYRLGDMDGAKLITLLKAEDPHASIIIITGYSDIKTAVEVIKLGAFDYITKPLIPDEVLAMLNLIMQKNSPGGLAENDQERKQLPVQPATYFKGVSPAALDLYEQAKIVAETNYSVVLYGESGTGKEVIARTIHDLSHRKNKPFVALDCGTLSRELAGSELFGHMKGAFTGALVDKEGHFEMAEGGTLFLDEIGNLSLEVQAGLLRVIQERKFKRVGGNKEIATDVRIIVASNENLKQAYQKGRFREDLYHRFNEFSIYLPPLRERKEDIVPLSEFFLQQCCIETGKTVSGFDEEVLAVFMKHTWPGNLRELRNVVRRSILLTKEGNRILTSTLAPEIIHAYAAPEKVQQYDEVTAISNGNSDIISPDLLKGVASRAEYNTIMAVLQKVNFNKKKAAELLKIDRKTLYNKLKGFQH